MYLSIASCLVFEAYIPLIAIASLKLKFDLINISRFAELE